MTKIKECKTCETIYDCPVCGIEVDQPNWTCDVCLDYEIDCDHGAFDDYEF